MAMKESTKTVLEYLLAHDGEDFTAADVAEATGLTLRQVNGVFTMCVQCRADNTYGYRQEAKVETEDGVEIVKFLRLNEAGRAKDWFGGK